MASAREIKRKIKSVNSMQQITKAMNLVSAAKLQRARSALDDVRLFAEHTQGAIASIVNGAGKNTHPFLEVREVKKTLVVVIASDRGLCGGFNANISKETLEMINSKGDVECITIGNKVKDYLTRRKKNIIEHFAGVSETPDYPLAAAIGKTAVSKFLTKEVDEVYVAYTKFRSTIQYDPVMMRVLPVDTAAFKDLPKTSSQMIFEPSENEVLDVVIPKYVNITIFDALMESSASQQGARMTAMDSATKNAGEMIDKYTLQFNRARQGAITQEITEIVGGANALN